MKATLPAFQSVSKPGTAWMFVITLLVVFVLIFGPAKAQGTDETVRQALISYGLDQVGVTIAGDTVMVQYLQPVSEIKSEEELATRIAEITETVNDTLSAQNTVEIRQRFDDGQIISITVDGGDASKFLNEEIGWNTFFDLMMIDPMTRGLWIVPGTCMSDRGDSCQYSRACACYANETCDPSNPAADERGCVKTRTPLNAHRAGAKYVCDDGFEWNGELTDCVPSLVCPENAFEFQRECYCLDGYHWNADMTACIPGSYYRIDGDYNGDEVITVLDALAALKMSIKTLEEDWNLDMDQNGRITADDARTLLVMAVNRI